MPAAFHIRPCFLPLIALFMCCSSGGAAEKPAEPASTPRPSQPTDPGPLPLLTQAAQERKTSLLPDADQWQLDGGGWVRGTWKASGLKLDGRELDADALVAFFPSPAGVRVFLRDGQVLRGRLAWEAAEFDSRELGRVKLRAEDPGSVILRIGAKDTPPGPTPAAWLVDTPGGSVLAVHALPAASPLRCLTVLGGMDIPWEQVESLRALPPAGLEHETRLRDGTRLRAWLRLEGCGMPAASCHAWARGQQQLAALLHAPPAADPPTTGGLVLTDGSLLAGQVEAEALAWWVDGAELRLPRAALSSLERLPAADEAAQPPGPVFSLRTAGEKLAARPVTAHLAWRRGGQALAVPWHLVQSIQPHADRPAKTSPP